MVPEAGAKVRRFGPESPRMGGVGPPARVRARPAPRARAPTLSAPGAPYPCVRPIVPPNENKWQVDVRDDRDEPRAVEPSREPGAGVQDDAQSLAHGLDTQIGVRVVSGPRRKAGGLAGGENGRRVAVTVPSARDEEGLLTQLREAHLIALRQRVVSPEVHDRRLVDRRRAEGLDRRRAEHEREVQLVLDHVLDEDTGGVLMRAHHDARRRRAPLLEQSP